MKYHLYDEHERHQGKFNSVYELRKFYVTESMMLIVILTYRVRLTILSQ